MDNIENHDATQTIVSYHGGCPDGMGAMLSAYLIFGEKAQYVPVVHTEPFPDALQPLLTDLSNKVIYCLDYCPKEPYFPLNVDNWLKLVVAVEENPSRFIQDGESILRYKDVLVNATLKTARKVNFLGYNVLAANTHEWLASDVGNTLAEGYPFSVMYFDMDGQRKFSLRSSKENGLNVRVICELLGGGGHVHAGGCQVSFDKLNHEGMPNLPME